MILKWNILLAIILSMPLIAQDADKNCDSIWRQGAFIPTTKRHITGEYCRVDGFSGEILKFFLNDSVFFKSWTDLSEPEFDRPVLGIAGTYQSSNDTISILFTQYVFNTELDSTRITHAKEGESEHIRQMNAQNVYLLKYIRPYVFLVKPNENASNRFCHFLATTQKWSRHEPKVTDEFLRKFFQTLFLTKQIGT